MEVFQDNNRTQGNRVLRRIPIALFILFLFATSLWASWFWGAISVGVATAYFGIVLLVAFLHKVGNNAYVNNKVAKPIMVIKFPLYAYIGRNNYLWFWLVLFTFAATYLYSKTEPEPLVEHEAISKKLSSEDRAIEQLEQRRQAIRDEWENVDRIGIMVSNEQLQLDEVNSTESRMEPVKARSRSMLILWLLIIPYGCFAFVDEVKDGVKVAIKNWGPHTEGISKPFLMDAAASWVGIPVGASVAADAVSAAGNVTKKSGMFVLDVAKYAIAEIFGNWFRSGRRR